MGAATMGSGKTIPPSPTKLHQHPPPPPPSRSFSEPSFFTPNPTAGQPTHRSTSGGFPWQKTHMYVHPEVSTGILLQPLWRTPPPPPPKQDKSSRGSVDTTKTCSDPQRVRMSSGERPIGTAKGKQPNTKALPRPPPPQHYSNGGPRITIALPQLNRAVPPQNTNKYVTPGASITLSPPPTPRPAPYGAPGLAGQRLMPS